MSGPQQHVAAEVLCRDTYGIERVMRWDAEEGKYCGSIQVSGEAMGIWLSPETVEIISRDLSAGADTGLGHRTEVQGAGAAEAEAA